MNFAGLRDHIEESTTEIVGSFLSQEEIQKFTPIFWDMWEISIRLSQMKSKHEQTLNTLDFDDTMSSRDKSLQKPKFMDNRGQAWNDLIEREYGYDRFVYEHYKRRDVVNDLVNVIMSDDAYREPFILTAWVESLQKTKIERTKLKKPKTSIVKSQSLKPRELLRHIMDDLWYIPGKIIIYEDRPECFIETGAFLAKLLWCEIVINHVTLSEARFNTIDNIKQTIFKR